MDGIGPLLHTLEQISVKSSAIKVATPNSCELLWILSVFIYSFVIKIKPFKSVKKNPTEKTLYYYITIK